MTIYIRTLSRHRKLLSKRLKLTEIQLLKLHQYAINKGYFTLNEMPFCEIVRGINFQCELRLF